MTHVRFGELILQHTHDYAIFLRCNYMRQWYEIAGVPLPWVYGSRWLHTPLQQGSFTQCGDPSIDASPQVLVAWQPDATYRWTTETKFEGTCQRRSNMKPHDLMNSWWMLLFQGRFDIRSVIHAWHNVMECKSISWKVAVISAREWPVGFEVVKIYWEANIIPRAICLNRIIIVHSGGPFAWCAVCVFSVGCESWCSLDAYTWMLMM